MQLFMDLIRFAFLHAEYRRRAEPQQIIEVLQSFHQQER
jgi:hypothetical protein